MVEQCNHQIVSRVIRFIKEQEARGLLSKIGIKKPLNKIPLRGDILF